FRPRHGSLRRVCEHGSRSWAEFLKLSFLTHIPPRGIFSSMENDKREARLKRLRRIEGQVRGIARMVEEDRYCIDIMTQIAAIHAALRRVEEDVLEDHLNHCVTDAINSGDKAEQQQKIAELMEVLQRARR